MQDIELLKSEIAVTEGLGVVPTDLWWSENIRHIESGREVRVTFNSMRIEYFTVSVGNGSTTSRYWNEGDMLHYLRTAELRGSSYF